MLLYTKHLVSVLSIFSLLHLSSIILLSLRGTYDTQICTYVHERNLHVRFALRTCSSKYYITSYILLLLIYVQMYQPLVSNEENPFMIDKTSARPGERAMSLDYNIYEIPRT